MNGRAYDYQLGRFLSVDPFIQGISSDAINPYSYIGNNPLSGTDPTGYISCTDTEETKCTMSDYAKNGVHEHTDVNGKKTTIVVGEAGDTVSASNGEETKSTTIENKGGFDSSKIGDSKWTLEAIKANPDAFLDSATPLKDAYKDSKDLNEAANKMRDKKDAGKEDVSGTEDQREFVEGMNDALTLKIHDRNSELGNNQKELILTIRQNSNGEFAVSNAYWAPEGGDVSFPSNTVFSLHWHPITNQKRPDKGDHGLTKRRNLPGYVITFYTRKRRSTDYKIRVWEIGRVGGWYKYRHIGPGVEPKNYGGWMDAGVKSHWNPGR
jgi:hypothetical protein